MKNILNILSKLVAGDPVHLIAKENSEKYKKNNEHQFHLLMI